MFTDIAITPMFVTDHDEALDFYVGKLGMKVHTDADLGFMRWLTVCLPDNESREILLEKPGPPARDPQTAATLRELTAKGATTWMILHTADVAATHRALVEAGVEVTEEPTDREYGIDMAIRDPFGNQIRITQPPAAG